jgi:Reverse transcriptase (RNA-dependent DNA polymerase)
MALTAVKDLECYQFDFKTAFLNAWIPYGTDYFVEQPHDLEKKSIGMVCKLQKALYGLRRSPLYWFQAIMPTEDLNHSALISAYLSTANMKYTLFSMLMIFLYLHRV